MALLTHRDHEERPWGFSERFTLNEPATVKIMRIKPHQRFSLQTHAKRAEFWRILSGNGTVTVNGLEHLAKVSDEFEILVGAPHRAAAGEEELCFLEIALGDFNEHDETRLEDDYGRTSPTP